MAKSKFKQKLGGALRAAKALGSPAARTAQYWTKQARLQRRWERVRREQGFHWDALKRHAFEGPPGIANLQDYWRCAPGTATPRSEAEIKAELVTDEHGVVWHLAHLPFDAKPAHGKAKAHWNDRDWAKLETIITERIEKGGPTQAGVKGVAVGADKRARLDGVVLRTLPRVNAPLHIACPYAKFSKSVVAEGMTFGSCALFQHAHFRHGVRFCHAAFPNGAYFREALFVRNAEFSGAHFGDLADFEGAVFCAIAAFRPCEKEGVEDPVVAKFVGVAKFNKVRFRHRAYFDGAIFKEKAAFDRSQFRWPAYFEAAKFHKAAVFSDAKFERRANFANAVFKKSAHFHGAAFHRMCAFEGAELCADTSFDGTHFRVIEKLAAIARGFFWVFLAIAAVVIFWPGFDWAPDWARRGLILVPTLLWLLATRFFVRDLHIERLARSYRQLGKQMEDLGNKKDAARFLRHEQRALRLRWKLNPPGRILSMIYDAIASYGDSVFRPLVLLTVSVALFAAIYFTWRRGDVDAWPTLGPHDAAARSEIIGAVEFSAQNVVQPFGVWAPPPPTGEEGCPFRSQLLVTGARKTQTGIERCRPPWMMDDAAAGRANPHRFAVRAVSALQSLISAILIFLIALAARRRFSVS